MVNQGRQLKYNREAKESRY